MPNLTIYFDMDGTLAEWQESGRYWMDGYYRTLPPMENMVAAARKFVHDGVKVKILSAVLQDEHSARDKHAWLNGFLPEIGMDDRIFVPYGRNKADYILSPAECQKDILIDDYTLNLETWNGISIKCLNGINNRTRRWTGWSVDASDSPRNICATILRIAAQYEERR